MTKPENTVLVIEPSTELKFEGPFNNMPVLSFIKLCSVTDKKILFKLKTTAPKKYCVRPNSGVLYPKTKQEIQVSLQPFVFSASEKLKHKFMVQFVIEPEGERSIATEDIWKSIAPDKIMNYKLKCVFVEQPALPGNDVTEQPPGSDVVLYPEPKAKKVADVPSLMGNGGELQKVAAEVKQLREEESKLRQDNIAYKEEISRLRQKLNKESERHTYSPPAYQVDQIESRASGPIPMTYIFAAMIIAGISFLLGKFFN